MKTSMLLNIVPDSEYNKNMLADYELYYKDIGVNFHSNYQTIDKKWEWKDPTTLRKVFAEIIKRIPINKDWVFLDCGCGLGHVMYLASFYFNKVYGVEYIAEIAEIAEQNLRKLLPDNNSYNIFLCDMFDMDKKIINKSSVFYMSSPFIGENEFDKFIKIIIDSLHTREREIWILYYYPYCEHVMEKYKDIFPLVDVLETTGKVNYYNHSIRKIQ